MHCNIRRWELAHPPRNVGAAPPAGSAPLGSAPPPVDMGAASPAGSLGPAPPPGNVRAA